jgi:hypothetical protein
MKSEKTAKRRDRSRKKAQTGWPFERTNYLLFGLSLAIIIVGFVFMTQGPWDSFFSLTLAPIFLVIGYCVTLPMAILYRKKNQS